MEIVILALLVAILALLVFNILRGAKKTQSESVLEEIDTSIDLQRKTLSELTKDIQSFNEPLTKLNRYLSGGTLAGKFGEWSLESIIQDIFHPNQYDSNAEVIPGSGKRVEFVVKLP